MLKYCVLSRGDEISDQLKQTFETLASSKGLQKDCNKPDIVVSIGGDGTMLQAFHSFFHLLENIAFVGVHTGHLGFYADWQADEIEALVELMAAKPHSIPPVVEYPIVKAEITDLQDEVKTYYALNEVTIRGGNATLVAQLCINNAQFEMFRGDGICISTPTGSTAYNKSLDGAIVHPALETIQIAEMASINNRVFRTLGSSMLLPKHHFCDINPRDGQNLFIMIDHLQLKINQLQSIRCQVADQKVRFARYRPFPFWTRVKEAFIDSKYD